MEQTVGIVVDSTGDIPGEIADDLGITVVRLSFSIEGETFLDGDLSQEEFFARMNASKQLPMTTQPSVGMFIETFQQALQRYAHVVCVCVSNHLSGTIESAREAARIVGDRVSVHDSLNLSFGEGYQAVLAARAARAGATVEEVLRVAEEARGRIHMLVGLDSLENLKKGGRIGRVSALLGGLLNLKVLLTVDPEGFLIPVARIRGASAALDATMQWLAERIDPARPAVFAVQHAVSADKAAWLEAQIRDRFTVAEIIDAPAGTVISTHTGSGWGVTAYQVS